MNGKGNGFGHANNRTAPIRINDAQGHDLGIRRDQMNDARDMRAMPIHFIYPSVPVVITAIGDVLWRGIVIHKVVALHQASCQSRMIRLHPSVKNGHKGACATRNRMGLRQP